jgi:excisionase family DNA binding protein
MIEVMKQFLTAAEVAKLLNVDRATVIRWIRRDMVKHAHRPPGSRQWRIPLASYVELLQHKR